METTVTPKELEAKLGVDAKWVRKWLRENGFQVVRYAQYHLTPERADQVRAHFRE